MVEVLVDGYIGHYVLAFALTVGLVFVLRRPAVALGFVDEPGGRKQHESPVPLVGGITMYLAFLAVFLLIWPFHSPAYPSLIAGITILVAVGLLDDFHEIEPWARFFVQVLAALMMTSWGEVQVASLGDLAGTGELVLGEWSIPFTVICVVAIINAVNMHDGFDGLAGGIVMVALVWLGVIAATAGVDSSSVPLLLSLAAVIAGFLVFNLRAPWRKRASIFMGDSGAFMLGFALAWFAVYVAGQEPGEIPPMTIAWVLAFPTHETAVLVIKRLAKGRHPFESGRDHMHHILMEAGMSSSAVVAAIMLVCLAYGVIGYAGWATGAPEWSMFTAFVAMGFVHLWFSASGWRQLKSARASIRELL